jgi:hypothetical protein
MMLLIAGVAVVALILAIKIARVIFRLVFALIGLGRLGERFGGSS